MYILYFAIIAGSRFRKKTKIKKEQHFKNKKITKLN